MHIDFKEAFARQQPPSTKELAEVKKRLTQERDALSKRVKIIALLYWVIVCAGMIGVFALMYFGKPVLFITALIVTAMFAVRPIGRPFKTASQLNLTHAELRNLTTTDASNMPDECIKLDEWRNKDKTIDAYLSAINGRNPVIGEHLAAMEWREGRVEQEKTTRAKKACEQFA